MTKTVKDRQPHHWRRQPDLIQSMTNTKTENVEQLPHRSISLQLPDVISSAVQCLRWMQRRH